MKTTGNLLLVLTLFLGTVDPASAQMGKLANSTPQQRADLQTNYMKTKLALTPDQLPKIAAINLEYAEQMEPVLKGADGGFAKMREARDIQSAKDTALRAVLTPAQVETYEAMKDEMRQELEQKLESGS